MWVPHQNVTFASKIFNFNKKKWKTRSSLCSLSFNVLTLTTCSIKLQNRYLDFWHKLLFNDNRVIGGNKLRTYRKIKTDFKREQYLYADVDKKSL